MKNIGKCKKWRILACIGILCMLFACADHMLQDDERSTTRRSKNKIENSHHQQLKSGLKVIMLRL